jgi:alcohol dehydrogenase
MRALVYHGPGRKSWDEVPDPVIQQDTDAVVRVDAVTICGTDLHILKGDVPAVTDGRILGHEAVGTVTAVGAGVKTVQVGDHVLVSCITACGRCRYNSLHQVPAGVSDEEVLMLADILPTGYEVGVLNGAVRPGDTVAVVGSGPIGLAAMVGARLFSPGHVVAIDLAASRLEAAKQFGADVVVDASQDDPVARVNELTGGLGADVAIEAVGVPETFETCTRLVRPGGRVANVGVHGKPATLHLEDLWIKNLTVRTGLVDTYSTPTLLRLVATHQIDSARFITHRFGFDEFLDAYDVFSRAGDTGALKVVVARH